MVAASSNPRKSMQIQIHLTPRAKPLATQQHRLPVWEQYCSLSLIVEFLGVFLESVKDSSVNPKHYISPELEVLGWTQMPPHSYPMYGFVVVQLEA